MKAVVKTEPGYAKVALQEVPEPHAATGQVVIEVEACGICGTDIHHYDDEFPSKPLVVLGHEMSGHIVEIGPEVSRFNTGDRVTINPTAGQLCGRCRYCDMGVPFLCMNRGAHGSELDGGFAKYCCAREEIVYRLPDTISIAMRAPSASRWPAISRRGGAHQYHGRRPRGGKRSRPHRYALRDARSDAGRACRHAWHLCRQSEDGPQPKA